jgi:hypothetical protein
MALAEKGDDAVGELAEGHRVERCGVGPIDDERAVAADPFETFTRRAFRGRLCGIQGDAACSISSPKKVLLRSSGQPLRMACASAHLASMRKGMSPQRPLLSRTLWSVGWLSIQTVLSGANSSPRATPVMGNRCPCAYCQTRTEQLTRPAGLVWCADITYIPIGRGFLYLVALMDWASRAAHAGQDLMAMRRFARFKPGSGLSKSSGRRRGSVENCEGQAMKHF